MKNPNLRRLLILTQIAVTLVGIAFLLVASVLSGGGEMNFGGIGIIGPIPILIGAGSEASWLIILAAILTIAAMAVFVLLRRKMKTQV